MRRILYPHLITTWLSDALAKTNDNWLCAAGINDAPAHATCCLCHPAGVVKHAHDQSTPSHATGSRFVCWHWFQANLRQRWAFECDFLSRPSTAWSTTICMPPHHAAKHNSGCMHTIWCSSMHGVQRPHMPLIVQPQ